MDDQPTPHTYEQAAAALGIQAEAVRARLRRGALRRGPRTNDGRPTVLLSQADIATIKAGLRTAVHPESGPESSPDADTKPGNVLLALLRDQLERAQVDADIARAAMVDAQERWGGRLDRLAAELAETRKGWAEANARAAAEARQAAEADARAVDAIRRAEAAEDAQRAWQAASWWRRLVGRS